MRMGIVYKATRGTCLTSKADLGRFTKQVNYSLFELQSFIQPICFIHSTTPQIKMHSTVIIAAFLAAVASSSPVTVPRSQATLPFTGNFTLPKEYNSTVWVPGTVLKAHQVLLFGEDRAEVVDQDVWTDLIEPQLNQIHAIDEAAVINDIVSRDEHWDEKRECQVITSAVTDKTETFVDWDVQMSPVVSACYSEQWLKSSD